MGTENAEIARSTRVISVQNSVIPVQISVFSVVKSPRYSRAGHPGRSRRPPMNPDASKGIWHASCQGTLPECRGHVGQRWWNLW